MALKNCSTPGSSWGGVRSRAASRWQSLGSPPTTHMETSTGRTSLCNPAIVNLENQQPLSNYNPKKMIFEDRLRLRKLTLTFPRFRILPSPEHAKTSTRELLKHGGK